MHSEYVVKYKDKRTDLEHQFQCFAESPGKAMDLFMLWRKDMSGLEIVEAFRPSPFELTVFPESADLEPYVSIPADERLCEHVMLNYHKYAQRICEDQLKSLVYTERFPIKDCKCFVVMRNVKAVGFWAYHEDEQCRHIQFMNIISEDARVQQSALRCIIKTLTQDGPTSITWDCYLPGWASAFLETQGFRPLVTTYGGFVK